MVTRLQNDLLCSAAEYRHLDPSESQDEWMAAVCGLKNVRTVRSQLYAVSAELGVELDGSWRSLLRRVTDEAGRRGYYNQAYSHEVEMDRKVPVLP
jgi:hypothetical protein